jgi:hypothetical protein
MCANHSQYRGLIWNSRSNAFRKYLNHLFAVLVPATNRFHPAKRRFTHANSKVGVIRQLLKTSFWAIIYILSESLYAKFNLCLCSRISARRQVDSLGSLGMHYKNSQIARKSSSDRRVPDASVHRTVLFQSRTMRLAPGPPANRAAECKKLCLLDSTSDKDRAAPGTFRANG